MFLMIQYIFSWCLAEKDRKYDCISEMMNKGQKTFT